MKGYDRTRRIAEAIRQELASAITGGMIFHPHASMLSFTAVKLTRDLAFAKVYVTHVLNDEAERSTLIAELNQKAGLFRHHLAKTLTVRKVPQLTFVYDESIAYGAKMETLLHNLVKDLPEETQ